MAERAETDDVAALAAVFKPHSVVCIHRGRDAREIRGGKSMAGARCVGDDGLRI